MTLLAADRPTPGDHASSPAATPGTAPRAIGEVVDVAGTSVLLEGHLDIDDSAGIRPLRLPRDAWRHFPPNGETLGAIVSNASGVRLRVRTAATRLELGLRCTQLFFEQLPGPVNDIVVEVDGTAVGIVRAPVHDIRRVTFAGDRSETITQEEPSVVSFAGLPTGDKTVTIWLPQGMIVDLRSLSGDAPISAAEPSTAPVWIHHGSSISHCVETPSPTGVWPVVAARAAGLSLVNLGFGGHCMLDPFVADAIAATPADVISLKVGVNIVGARAMDQRTFVPAVHGFLDRVRAGHPDTPIVLASSILWPGSENVPGPADVEFLEGGRVRCHTAGERGDVAKGALTMVESRRHLELVVRERAAAGERIFFLDGLELYGPGDVPRFTLPDSLHPDTELYAEIGARFAARVFGPAGPVPRATLG